MKVVLLILATGLVLASCASLEQKVDGMMTPKWDKTVKTTAVIYYDQNIGIFKIDGTPKVNAFKQEVAMQGSGTVKKPKAQIVIPSGDRKLLLGVQKDTTGIAKTFGERRYEVPYTFVAGRYYQLTASDNTDFVNPKFAEIYKQQAELEKKIKELDAQAQEAVKNKNNAEATRIGNEIKNVHNPAQLKLAQEVLKLSVQLGEDQYATNIEIIDITGGKKKNSPSSVIVVKSWETKK